MQIDLILLNQKIDNKPEWTMGHSWATQPDPIAVDQTIQDVLQVSGASHYLFWDDTIEYPQIEALEKTLKIPGDVWHAGLKLGTRGLPHLMDFVNPIWRFTRDPSPDITATSWRLSLKACLLKSEILRQLGGPDPTFDTLAGAGLELGHRWLRRGAMLMNVPTLVSTPTDLIISIPVADELRFIYYRYGRLWARWALLRAWRHRVAPWPQLWQAWQAAKQKKQAFPQKVPLARTDNQAPHLEEMAVTVLIPTLDRYPYLFQVLDQLRRQSYPIHEIIVIDQTEAERRLHTWPDQFADLPLQVIWQEKPGQCSSRNAGLQRATGDVVLFLDDDDEIEPDLIKIHIQFMAKYKVAASCGVAVEVGAGNLPYDFTYVRASDVFPTNNSLLRRDALKTSGLFDLAYETGSRADGDLGMRLYLSGQNLALNPEAEIIHHHAPRGGLRQHKAREITRGGSKNSIRQRQLLEPTEAYLWLRYFTKMQVQEAVLIRSISTLRGVGKNWQRLLRFLYMMMLLPITYYQNVGRLKLGEAKILDYPQIPFLHDEEERD